jgi:hypothetical protein
LFFLLGGVHCPSSQRDPFAFHVPTLTPADGKKKEAGFAPCLFPDSINKYNPTNSFASLIKNSIAD